MNLLAAWKKVLLFGLFGAAGCLAGWGVGEGYLLAARATADPAAGQAGTLISKPSTPPTNAPPPPEEFQARLAREGAKTGDVQISLIWFDRNDLDLHCKAPGDDREIYFGHRVSRSLGELDVDANAGSRVTSEPVENIYWPKDLAPHGKYTVSVNFFNRRDGEPQTTRYTVSILRGGEREQYTGEITYGGTASNKRLIREFQLDPRLELVAPEHLELPPNSTARVPVVVRRMFYRGEVKVRAENLPAGVTADPLTIPTGMTEGELVLRAPEGAKELKTVVKLVATGGELTGSADAQLTVTPPKVQFSGTWVVLIGLWTAILAVGLVLALMLGQNYYLKRPLFAAGRIPLVAVVLGAVLAGFVSGSVGQALYSVLLAVGAGGVGFVIGWVLLGALLGWGVSFFVANLDKKKAAVAGLVGGLFGAVAYLVWSNAADWLGRLGGAAVLGFCIGLVVAVVEAAFRRSWLEVRFGERERITVNLGPEPVKVGGDAQACAVWARGAAPVALRYFVRNGQVICEDTQSRSESVAGDGHARALGTVTVIVRTGPSAGSAPPALAKASAPLPRVAPVARPPIPAPPVPTAVEADPFDFSAPAAPPKPVPAPPKAPAPAPVAKAPPPAPRPAFGSGLSVSPPPARPAAKSALDDDGFPPARAPAAPKLPAPKPVATTPVKPPAPAAPKPPAPAAPKPPAPAAPKPPTPAAPASVAKPPVPGPAVKPPAPKPVAPAKPPVPAKPAATAPPKPAAPAAPKPPTAAPPGAAKPAANPDACPTCGRAAPGKPGTRYCMMCEKTF